MENTVSLTLKEISDRIDEIGNIEDIQEKTTQTRKFFAEVLKNNEFYVLGQPGTTEEDIQSGKIRPYIANGPKGNYSYIRVFTDIELAYKAAQRVKAVINGKEMILKIDTENLTDIVRDYFLMGMDGILLNDGARWITYTCEAFLGVAYHDVLNIPDKFQVSFINTVRAIHDIAKKRVRIVAPVKYYEDIKEEDIFNGKAELYNFDKEILFIEYYDKYKVENVFKEKVFWVDIPIERLYEIIEKANEANLNNVKIAYNGRQANGNPKNILVLLEQLGFKPIK